MPSTRKHARRLRIAARRWFSKNHSDFQTLGRLTAWWLRRSQSETRPAAPEQRPAAAHLPALSRIVSVRREGAVVHVVCRARCVAFDGRPLVLASDAANAPTAAGDLSRTADPGAEGQTCTVTLALN